MNLSGGFFYSPRPHSSAALPLSDPHVAGAAHSPSIFTPAPACALAQPVMTHDPALPAHALRYEGALLSGGRDSVVALSMLPSRRKSYAEFRSCSMGERFCKITQRDNVMCTRGLTRPRGYHTFDKVAEPITRDYAPRRASGAELDVHNGVGKGWCTCCGESRCYCQYDGSCP